MSDETSKINEDHHPEFRWALGAAFLSLVLWLSGRVIAFFLLNAVGQTEDIDKIASLTQQVNIVTIVSEVAFVLMIVCIMALLFFIVKRMDSKTD